MDVSERVPLKYAFRTSRSQKWTKQFQCCFGALILVLLMFSMIVYVSVVKNDDDDVLKAIQIGQKALRIRHHIEEEQQQQQLQSFSPSFRHQKSVATSAKADRLGRRGYATYYATRMYAQIKRQYSAHPMEESVCNFQYLRNAKLCSPERAISACNFTAKYRTIDGSCNNVAHPFEWGVAFMPFRRLLPPDYADGIGEPRTRSKNKILLPAASTVSDFIHRPSYKNDARFNIMLAVWGQFIDHDITSTALSRTKNGLPIPCCMKQSHPECFPVLKEYGHNGSSVQCVEFVRSAPAVTCCFGPRQQINQATSFLDASVVYGTERALMRKLRSFHNGRLAMFITADGRELLPISTDLNDGCNRIEMIKENKYCFQSGDNRANENLHLVTMHLLWARQHNRIALQLQHVNSHWNDDRLFEETRRIVAAQIQHITYTEFLPLIIGDSLLGQHHHYYTGYNDTIDVSVSNVFAAAIFRFAHSLIPSQIKLIDHNDTSTVLRLRDVLFDPFRLYNKGDLDRIIRGGLETETDPFDSFFTIELKKHLFQTGKYSAGLDLVALNIQRGRDHGLAAYVQWRRFCNLSVPKTFADMVGYIDGELLTRIESLYESVDDVDLYTGALAERPLADGILGPTANCLIAEQFGRVKRGDRFWYENPDQFTLDQLNAIRRTTSLATILCDNSDALQFTPPFVMVQPNQNGNQYVHCSLIERLNFEHWKEIDQ